MANWCKEVIDRETHRLLKPSDRTDFPDYPNYQNSDGTVKCNIELDATFMQSHGYSDWTAEEEAEWHRRFDPEPEPYVRSRCTKYQLVTCLSAHYPELLTRLRAAYAANADLQFYWNTVNDLDRNNADFKTAQAALGITDEQVAEIFEKIEGREPEAVNE